MPSYVIRFERDGQEWFGLWSTVVDAPTTCALTEDELRATYNVLVEEPRGDLNERIDRARLRGHSARPFPDAPDWKCLDDLIGFNRAGEDEECLTVDEVLDGMIAARSIETAPKDGTEVILRVKMRAGIPGGTLVGHYMRGGHCIEDHPPIDAGWYFWTGRMFDLASEPTHWMPLPRPPEIVP